jgi:hypothetical protein
MAMAHELEFGSMQDRYFAKSIVSLRYFARNLHNPLKAKLTLEEGPSYMYLGGAIPEGQTISD